MYLYIHSLMLVSCFLSSTFGFVSLATLYKSPESRTVVQMSLKPAAPGLLDSGKALARSGELLIDLTSELDLYGGALSSAGAQIRNSGDCVAQAAASCRFKTGEELVCDELREGATCLTGASEKLNLAVDEAFTDNNVKLAEVVGNISSFLASAGADLELAGAFIMTNRPSQDIGKKLADCGRGLEAASNQIISLAPDQSAAEVCSQRMAFAAERMLEAANELQGVQKPKPKGKGWLKQ
eukprot:scaffold2816_cov121-Cylindrotheca_fusiformis.AAC.58